MDGSPNPSPAWIVMWKFSRATYWNASRCRLGGLPAPAPAMSHPTTPAARCRTARPAISTDPAPGPLAGDVDPDHPGVPVPPRQLGDLQRSRRGPHRREQGIYGDIAAAAAAPEALEYRVDHLVQAQSPGHVQLRRDPDLRVHHAVVGQGFGALGRHPDQRVPGLHDPDRVLQRLQVELAE